MTAPEAHVVTSDELRELVGDLHNEQYSGAIRVDTRTGAGYLRLEMGQITEVRFQALTGQAALMRLLAVAGGVSRVSKTEPQDVQSDSTPPEERLLASETRLIPGATVVLGQPPLPETRPAGPIVPNRPILVQGPTTAASAPTPLGHEAAQTAALEAPTGIPLSEFFSQVRALSPTLIVTVIESAIAAVQTAHEHVRSSGKTRVALHGDVALQNFWVDEAGVCHLHEAHGTLAEPRAKSRSPRRGRPAYLSPESVLGKRLDQRSDIFSLGVTLWTVLAGEPLFAATTTERTLENVLREPVRAPSLLGSKQLAQLDRVCLRALERDPSRRYSSAQAMLKDFRSAVARMGLTPDRELVRNWVTEAHRSAHGGHAGTHRWATLGNEFLLTSLQSEIQALPDPRPSYHRTIGWALSGGVLLIAALALYWWRTT